jgi:hypothetical protein
VHALAAEYWSVTAVGYLETQHFPQLGGMEGMSLYLELHFGWQMPYVLQLRKEKYEFILMRNFYCKVYLT